MKISRIHLIHNVSCVKADIGFVKCDSRYEDWVRTVQPVYYAEETLSRQVQVDVESLIYIFDIASMPDKVSVALLKSDISRVQTLEKRPLTNKRPGQAPRREKSESI